MRTQKGPAGNIRERVRANGTTYYQVRWWDTTGGRSVQQSASFPTRDEAEDHLLTVSRKKRDHTYRAPTPMTVSEQVRDYISRAVNRVDAMTTRTTRFRAKTMIDPTIGRRKLQSFTPLDVQRWIDELTSSGYKGSTANAAVTLLISAFDEAVSLEIIERNPGARIKRPTIRKSTMLIWNQDEVRRVLAHTHDDPIYGALYHVALATGMRPGELRALQWDDVNLTTGVIHIRRTMTRSAAGPEKIATQTKTNAGRAVALSPATIDLLKWHRRQQRERQIAQRTWHDLKLVFSRADGGWLNVSTWHREQTRICQSCGVPRIRLHDLRHTVATLMMAQNVHPKIVSDILGHATIKTTLDLYTHVSPGMQRTALQSLVDLFEQPDRDNMASQNSTQN